MLKNTCLNQRILNTGETTVIPPQVFNPYVCRLLGPMIVTKGAVIKNFPEWHTQIHQGDGHAFFFVCYEKDIKATVTAVAWTSHGADTIWTGLTQMFESQSLRIDGSELDDTHEVPDMPDQLPWMATYYMPTSFICPANRLWIEGFSQCLAAAIIRRGMTCRKLRTD